MLLGLDRYAAFAHRPGADSKAVVIYTTAWCPYCAKLRTSLAASGIPYVEHDVRPSMRVHPAKGVIKSDLPGPAA